MSDWRRPLAWALFAVATAAAIYVVVDGLINGQVGGGFRGAQDIFFVLLPVISAASGLLIISPRPDNSVGWILMIWGVGVAFVLLAELTVAGIQSPPASLDPGLFLLVWFQSWSWLLLIFPLFHLFQVFPTGHVLSPRWRWLVWLEMVMATSLILLSLFAAEIGPNVEEGAWTVPNPIGFVPDAFWEAWFTPVWAVGLVTLTLGGLVSIILRFRRAERVERQQLKLLMYAIGFFAVVYLAQGFTGESENPWAGDLLFSISLAAIPVAIAVAVLRFHLFDVDVVVSRTLVYGLLAVVITFVYVMIVIAIPTMIAGIEGGRGGENIFLLSTAAALVAILFQPLRRRLQRFANRLVYGKRATPYEVMSQFSRRLAATDEKLLDQVAESLAAGTAARGAAVWVRNDDRLERIRVWPPDDETPEPVPADTDQLPGADRAEFVTHDGRRLGALALTLGRGHKLTAVDERLLADLAGGMGLALQNAALTDDLHDRVMELRESRRRVVEAQDQTRRRLERDLHDGAQQQLVALKVKLSLARRMAAKAGAQRVESVLDGLNAEAEESIQSMRDLARGIYPPLLESEGLAPALAAMARKASLPVSVDTASLGRYAHQVEATIYFCVVELLENAVKHSRAKSVHITVGEVGGEVAFTVIDDGVGFDPKARGEGLTNIADRLDAMVGVLEVSSMPGMGASVGGRIPLDNRIPAAVAGVDNPVGP
ncbi:MAG TPA: histidine kinase [Acidimicrobiia bacterium]|jgi:signal transduction histidine kinase